MDTPFYKEGLYFQCARCSKCCRHDPGYVFLSKNDLIALSSLLKINKEEFLKKYCKIVNLGILRRISLIEKKNNDCIFWDNGGCTIYDQRPLQCKTYPFWSSVLNSPEDWEVLGRNCPGVNTGKHYTRKEIEEKLAMRRLDPLIEPDDE
ncbi:MAG: YkgJ family cysteine cluster protein [Spirochaetaceae bacterium]|nr:YkgJ family cysteine cluster protein [Spirochaetaceae bacterium]